MHAKAPAPLVGYYPCPHAAWVSNLARQVKTRLHSCGGTEGGAYLRAIASDGGGSLTDNEFVPATRFRLGMRVMGPLPCATAQASAPRWSLAVRRRITTAAAKVSGYVQQPWSPKAGMATTS